MKTNMFGGFSSSGNVCGVLGIPYSKRNVSTVVPVLLGSCRVLQLPEPAGDVPGLPGDAGRNPLCF